MLRKFVVLRSLLVSRPAGAPTVEFGAPEHYFHPITWKRP